MMLTEKHEEIKKGSYMDENIRSKMESIVLYQIQRAMDVGKQEGVIGEEMSLKDVKMTSFGFFTAYVQELVPLKIAECRVQTTEMSEDQTKVEIGLLKERTLKLLLKTLA